MSSIHGIRLQGFCDVADVGTILIKKKHLLWFYHVAILYHQECHTTVQSTSGVEVQLLPCKDLVGGSNPCVQAWLVYYSLRSFGLSFATPACVHGNAMAQMWG